jgi:hypothetical protein
MNCLNNDGSTDMTMHLAHPALTTAGKRKGKVKFRNSDEAKKARALEAEWKELQKKWGVEEEEKKRKRALSQPTLSYSLSAPPGRETQKVQSLNTGHTGAVRSKDIPQYTGTKVLGIGTMHKSNAVPIFAEEEAQDIARMRR